MGCSATECSERCRVVFSGCVSQGASSSGCVTHSPRDLLSPVLRASLAPGSDSPGWTAQVSKGPRATSQPRELEKSSGERTGVEEVRASCDPAKSVAGKSVGPEGGARTKRTGGARRPKRERTSQHGGHLPGWEQRPGPLGKSRQGGAPTSGECGSRRPGIPQGFN